MTQYVGKYLHTNLQARRTTDWRTTYPWPQPTLHYSAGTSTTWHRHTNHLIHTHTQ